MKLSQAFIPTLKEVPKDAVDASHVLLLRAGYIRMVGAGIYEMLPMGQRVLGNVTRIIREEMNRAGAQEILMPIMLPASYFQETGRWDVYGDVLVRLKDRKGGDYHLGPTHEEIVTDMIRRDLKSYKQLPQMLYQVQMKYRDEPRPRAGLMRGREFMMKDAYSFDIDLEAAMASYERMRVAYRKIFDRLGLEYRVVEADSGQIGGDTSAEFQILAQSGEDKIVACDTCDYAANVEVATARLALDAPAEPKFVAPEKVATPNTKTIDELVTFFEGDGIEAQSMIKAIALMTLEEEPRPVLALVRGDRELNEILVSKALSGTGVRLAEDGEIKSAFGADPGYIGPFGLADDVTLLMDHEVGVLRDAVCGGGEGHHFKGVSAGRDFEADTHALRFVEEGDGCPRCEGTLRTYRGIEGGHIFVLGTHYTEKMNATYLDKNGKAQHFVMGCYGIGVTRLVAAAVEQNHDDGGMIWPMPIAPFQATVLALGKNAEVLEAAEKVYEELKALGVDVLFDDRKERPGFKFKDADLVGIPLRVTVGGKTLAEGVAEYKERASNEDAVKVPLAEIAEKVKARVVELGGTLRF